ncbi:MAG TPA: TRAFs-binding domain-containing protein [Polyangiaceae bacterium]
MARPLCFVLMPFGRKPDPTGGEPIDFDRVYDTAIRQALDAAGLDAIRADEERTGGIIHKAMFERLLLCDYAIADLTCANANVFYELGVRHAVRPATTQVIFGKGHVPPFDVNYVRGMAYDLGANNVFSTDHAAALRDALSKRLRDLREQATGGSVTDSPLFQLLTDYGAPDIKRLKTDTFRDRVEYAAQTKASLASARDKKDIATLVAIEAGLGELDAVETGVLVDLYLSYRALSAWNRMVELHARLPKALQHTVLVREQLGFALNRLGQRQDALRVLEEVENEQGANSETSGLIGRVYKDLWVEAKQSGNTALAAGHLRSAVVAYERGFQSDFRDAYPGINAATLLDIQGTPKAEGRKREILPVVRFAVQRRLASGKADYWDRATLLEIAVLDADAEAAGDALADALSAQREQWEGESTANNLMLIREARLARGCSEPWLDDIIRALDKKRLPAT